MDHLALPFQHESGLLIKRYELLVADQCDAIVLFPVHLVGISQPFHVRLQALSRNAIVPKFGINNDRMYTHSPPGGVVLFHGFLRQGRGGESGIDEGDNLLDRLHAAHYVGADKFFLLHRANKEKLGGDIGQTVLDLGERGSLGGGIGGGLEFVDAGEIIGLGWAEFERADLEGAGRRHGNCEKEWIGMVFSNRDASYE